MSLQGWFVFAVLSFCTIAALAACTSDPCGNLVTGFINFSECTK